MVRSRIVAETAEPKRQATAARVRRWPVRVAVGAALGLALFAGAACGSTGSSSSTCNCPAGQLFVSVPTSRAADVQSVTATGACSHAAALDAELYSASEDAVGMCHIAVTFKSGAPEFDADVPLARGTYECEAVCAPTPTSSTPIAVPELDGAGGASDEPGQKG